MNTVIQDTCDVSFRRKSDGKLIFTAAAQMASIEQSITEDMLRGGIGNGVKFVLKSDKAVALTVRNAYFDREWLEMVSGASYENGTLNVTKKESVVATDNAGAIEATITGTPVGNVTFFDEHGERVVGTETTGVYTFTDVEDGDTLLAVYQEQATGDILNIDSQKFSEQYEVEYHTIEYSPVTNQIINDLYIQFDNVVPSESISLSFENGTALTPELSFNAIESSTSSVIGRIAEVPRTP